MSPDSIKANPARAAELAHAFELSTAQRTDRLFVILFVFQWIAGAVVALVYSPFAWEGAIRSTHAHVWAAVALGGLIASLPIWLGLVRPGQTITRMTIAVAQMLVGALLIHLTGGRIETHFHVFGSLAFLSFYRDWRVIVAASAVVAADHLLRGIYWPQSVFGVLTASPWRPLEHAAWVVFEDIFLITSCIQMRRELLRLADQQARLERANETVEAEVALRTRELGEARDEALESSRLKSEFLANMSHEIRTPLNGVLGMARLLLGTELSAEQRAYVATINSSGGSLLTVLNDILDLSKIEAGRLEIEKEEFDLRRVVEDSAALFAAKAAEKNLELTVSWERETPRIVNGARSRVSQVLHNLIGNAVKFTSDGSVSVRVSRSGLQSPPGHARIHVAVSDTGLGISSDKLDHIFDRFTQADSSTTRRFGGTGLGLAICRRLIEAMGGALGVESALGAGSTFSFELPFELNENERPPAPPPQLAGRRALVVAGNPIDRETALAELENARMGCSAGGSSGEARSWIEKAAAQGRPFDLILLEHRPPRLDGEELALWIRDRLAGSSPAIIMLLSARPQDEASPWHSLGLAGVILKPIRSLELLERCAAALAPDRGSPSPDAKRLSAPDAPGLLVLVVEDNPVNRLVASKMLERLGCRVETACDGQEAVDMFDPSRHRLVFMDCHMPVMDGFEATREIRRRGGEHTPILALTASAMADDQALCVAAGMDDYLTKPIEPDVLAQAVERWGSGRTAPLARR